MNSWFIIMILLFLLIISVGFILFFHWDMRKMTEQLQEIIEDFGTNELVRTHTHSKILTRFITSINQLIQVFKQNQQNILQREQELKQEITNISHDLRTPLTSIKGFSELLSDPSLSEAERQEFLTIIGKKIDNLIMVTDLFYDLSQNDSLDRPLTLEKQYLDRIVIEAMLLFYDKFEKRQLNVQVDEVNISPILSDQKATNRIVTNIIQNALQYAKSYVTVNFFEEDDYIRLRAVNDVEQFEHYDLERIFDRTFRADRSRTDGQLGLGLHIVQQLINKQDGNVAAEVHDNEFILDVYFRKWG